MTGGLLTGEKFVGVLLTCEKLHHDVKPGMWNCVNCELSSDVICLSLRHWSTTPTVQYFFVLMECFKFHSVKL